MTLVPLLTKNKAKLTLLKSRFSQILALNFMRGARTLLGPL